MKRLLTMNDVIHAYFSYYGNGTIQTSLFHRVNMMGEMNEIKEDYANIGGTWSDGTKITIKLVLRKCVRGILSRGHQYCIEGKAINNAVDNLLKGKYTKNGKKISFVNGKKISEDFEDFEELYNVVDDLINIKGIGEVTIYDTAKRIGHILDNPIYPQKYVFLPARKVKNAGSFIVGKEMDKKEPISLFYPHFGTLPPLFIEDILCIFSHWFWKYAKYPNNYPIFLVTKKEKRIGFPWWSLEVKEFLDRVLEKVHEEDIKGNTRWAEFPMITYPPTSVVNKNKPTFNPCNQCVYKK